MNKPLVSVVVPVYNKESHILQTLQTVRSQVFQEWECVIVNDGSTDDSLGLIMSTFHEEFEKGKFRIITTENSGQSAARNTGILACTGNYIALLDGDDLWHPNKLAWQYEILKRHPLCNLVLGAYCITQENAPKRIIRHSSGAQMLKDWIYLQGFGGAFESVALVRSEVLKGLLFDKNFSTSSGLEIFLRILEMNPLFAYDPRVQFTYKKYPGQWHTNFSELEKNLRNVAIRHFPDKIDKLEKNLAAYGASIRIKGCLRAKAYLELPKEFKLKYINFLLLKSLKFLSSARRGIVYIPSKPKLFFGKKPVKQQRTSCV